MLLINSLLILFLLLTVAAPAAMKAGWDIPGHLLYRIFKGFCHQFAFRSWFLFGQQAYYPRYPAGDLFTYEEMFGVSADDLVIASSIIGNAVAGYKIAICQRDIAMYTALLAVGLIFVLTGRRLKHLPLWVWLIFGVLPLGIDGLSQLSGTGWTILKWFPIRESTPLIRSITGGMFGLLSGWYIYPSIEKSFLDMHFDQTGVNAKRPQ